MNVLNLKTLGKILGPLGGVLVVASAASYMFVTGELSWQVWFPLIVGVACLGLFAWASGQELMNRGVVYSSVSLASTAVLVAGLAALNYVAVKKEKSWDLTKNQIFTLADQTQGALRGLSDGVRVTAFYRADEPGYQELDSLLRRYKEIGGDKFDYEFVDMYKNPERVAASNITQSGPRIVMTTKAGKEARAKEPSEEALTNALIEVTGGMEKKVYFLEGHGEKSFEDDGERGMKLLADAARTEGYRVEKLSLLEKTEVPSDAQVVIVAGPMSPLLEKEVESLKNYAEKGGKLLALLDPGVTTGLEATLNGWGVELKADTVVDVESQYWQWAVAQRYEKHAITTPRNSPFAMAAVFPLARSVHKADAAGYTVTELAHTGARAWGETGQLTEGAKLTYDGGDTKGPLPLAVASTKTVGAEEMRVAVFGDSDFASNANLKILGNRDLALNSIAWTAQQESKISIRPKARDASRLFLTREQKNNIAFSSFIMLPVMLLGAGLVMWQVRKNK